MNWKKITALFTATFIIVALLYDAFVVVTSGTESSISWLTITLAYKYPLIPFMCGILCGHFFWQVKGDRFKNEL
jgi:hypothetical protein